MHTTSDLDLAAHLNDDDIQPVQHSNVKRFDEILPDGFLSMPGGSPLDRKAFLQQTAAPPVTIRNTVRSSTCV